ncbi:MAG: hypothetical protein AAF633_11255 [Chloroflexota bacterium]
MSQKEIDNKTKIKDLKAVHIERFKYSKGYDLSGIEEQALAALQDHQIVPPHLAVQDYERLDRFIHNYIRGFVVGFAEGVMQVHRALILKQIEVKLDRIIDMTILEEIQDVLIDYHREGGDLRTIIHKVYA